MKYKNYCLLLILSTALALAGCSGKAVKNVAKSDVDLIADLAVQTLDDYLRRLSIELYRTNSDELTKSNFVLETRITQIVEYPVEVAYKELDFKQRTQAIELALDQSYKGDRVFALMIGISSTLRHSYNNQREFFIFDSIDPQELYNSSYNLQLLKQKLLDKEQDLIRIEQHYDDINNAYVLLDKISTTQDFMSQIMADRTSRVINKTLTGTASVFMPI